jgi:hypothetical protein
MVNITFTDEQIVEAFQQLSPEQKRRALFALAEQAQANRPARMAFAEHQIRRLARERGLDWDALSEAEREAFVDDLIHEDRQP